MAGSNADLVPDDLTGRDLPARLGRYQVVSILGQGGMARVFRAELIGAGAFRKQCALKVIHRSFVGEGDQIRQLLLNEARLGGLLKHPNIVDTYDCGEIDGQPFIAMELIRGLGLDAVLESNGALPPGIAMGVALQMCAALDHAHTLEEGDRPANLVHRDLKPSNVMLSRDGLVKLMDFGIAKASIVSGATTQTGMTKGTPQYMSPEQLQAKELDCRSDLFAAGAIIYELFTGRRLFRGENLGGIVLRIVTADDSLDEDGVFEELDEVVAGLGGVVRKAVRVDPDLRFRTAVELRAALRSLGVRTADTEDLKLWVREQMERAGTPSTTVDTPSLVARAEAPSDPFGDTTPLQLERAAPVVPETRPMRRPAGGGVTPTPPGSPAPTSDFGAQDRRSGFRRALVLGGLLLLAVAGGAVGVTALRGSGDPAAGETAAPAPSSRGVDVADSGAGTSLMSLEETAVGLDALAGAGGAERGSSVEAEATPEPGEVAAPEPTPMPTTSSTPAVREPPILRETTTPAPRESTPAPPPLTLVERQLPTQGHKNSTVEFIVETTGSRTANVSLRYRPPGADWSWLVLTKRSDGAFVGSLFLNLDWRGQSVEYYVKAHDGEQTDFIGSSASPRGLRVR